MASTVILLLSGPTAMNASSDGSRAISAVWLVENWLTATFSGSMPDSFRMTRSSLTLASVRPITPTRCPARASSVLTFNADCFLPFVGSPGADHSTTTFLRRMATDSAFSGRFRSPRATARSVLPALNSAMLCCAPSVVIGDSRTGLPSRAKVCHQLHQLVVLAAGRSDGNSQRRRPQDIIQRARSDAERQHARSEDKER